MDASLIQTAVLMDVQETMSGRNWNWNQNERELAHVNSLARSRIPRGYQSVEPVVQTESVNEMRGEMMMR